MTQASDRTEEKHQDTARAQGAADAGAGHGRMDAGLFAVSTAVLALEILQFKIFAFSLDPLTIYLAVGVCLLGLGASATILALVRPLSPEKVRARAALFAGLGAALIPLAHSLFAELSGGFQTVDAGTIVSLIALTAPYFCFGMTITLLLVARGKGVGRAYAANLAGSGLGCLIVFPLLDSLGAERALVLIAGIALLAALILECPRRPAARAGVLLLCLGFAAALVGARKLLVFPPDQSGQLTHVLQRIEGLREEKPQESFHATPLLSRWDRTARVDVYELDSTAPELRSQIGDPLDILFFVQDASAGSILICVEDDLERASQFFERTVYGAGYALGSPEHALLVGLGGAPDVLCALYHGAKRIDAVEINRATIDLVRNEFKDRLGDPYARPEVTIHEMDGRTFLRGTDQTFDHIQLSGVDTKSAFASGSLSVNENYLYTREAMGEMLRRLEPDGVLSIVRFSDTDAHRLTSIAIGGLTDLGVDDPHDHFIALAQGKWRGMLIKRTPFEAHEVERIHEWVNSEPRVPQIVIPPFNWIGLTLATPMRVIYSPDPLPVAETRYYKALIDGRMQKFIDLAATHGVDLSAPVDDRPFFFFRSSPEVALTNPPEGLKKLYMLVGQLSAVAVLFILVPLLVLRWRGLRTAGAGRTLVYFACLGAAFMLVEIGLIHRFVLYLGHQSYAVTVVLFGLLLGASFGSLVSGKLRQSGRLPIALAIGALVVVILAYGYGLGAVFDAALSPSFPVRLAVALAALIPLGFFLGIPFPFGLRALHASSVPLVAWSVGINGFASVVGSTIAVPIAMLVGLRTLLLVGAALYVLALLTAPLARANE